MDELKVLSWNCNGIEQKIPELTAFVNENKIDIILLGETRISPKRKLTIPNYFTYRTDRPKTTNTPNAGGTAILIRKNISHQHIILQTKMDSTTIQVKLNNKTAQISAAYKSPTAILHASDLDTLTNHNGPFLIAGDLNSKHPSWNSRLANTAGRKLLRHSEVNKYAIAGPDSPTYYPYNKKHQPDVLDIVLLDLQSAQHTLTNHNDLSSDHNPIQINIQGNPLSNYPPIAPKKTRINWTKFKEELSRKTKIERVKTPAEIDSKIEQLTNSIQKEIENASFTIKLKKPKPNLPGEILLEIETKRMLRKMWQNTRDPNTKKLYNSQIKYVKKLLTDHRQAAWDNFTETLNFKNKSLYQLNRRLLNKKPADTPLQTITGLKIHEADEKAELFADTMAGQFTNNPGEDIREVTQAIAEVDRDYATTTDYISPKQIKTIIKKLPTGKAPGHDNISNMALRNLPDNIITQLSYIFTASIRTSYFPTNWKKAIIVMIPKPNKNHSKPENYRPISLLTSISKVFEKIVLVFLKKHIKPRPEQHAFREGHSTITQLVQLLQDIKNNRNNKKTTAAAFLDIEKAFDRVWHQGLIYKLKTNTELPIHIIKLIKSFLTGRTFYIRVANHISTPRHIEAGVPQGSCLSPILYVLYINDLPLTVHSKTAIFADDTMFHSGNRNTNYAILQLQKQLDLAETWMKRWRLKLNIGKTEAILFGALPKQKTKKIKIQNQPIEWKQKIKYLGITIDHNLKMHHHATNAINKAKGVRAALYPVINSRSPIPIKTRLQIYSIYIKPVLLYGSVAWSTHISNSNWTKIEAVQNIALRVITGAQYYISNETLRKSTQLPSLYEAAETAVKIFFHKATMSKSTHIQQLTE